MPGHIKDSLVAHLSLLAVNHKKLQEEFVSQIKQQQDEIEALKEEVHQLREHMVSFPIYFFVKNPHQYDITSPWSSKHFYSHGGGYKLSITFYDHPFCGYLFQSFLTQGEYDSQLMWPMKAQIFMLIQHIRGEDLIFKISVKCDTPVTGGRSLYCGQWSSGKLRDMNGYLHDNCLCVRITSIQF